MLPINVMACKKMLVLCGKTYPARLWCAWELCTLFSFMREEQALERVELVATDSNVDVMEILTTFDVMNAHCYDPNEEAKLRRVIGEVGEERFNESIIKLSKSIIKDLEKKASWYAVKVGIRARVRARVKVTVRVTVEP